MVIVSAAWSMGGGVSGSKRNSSSISPRSTRSPGINVRLAEVPRCEVSSDGRLMSLWSMLRIDADHDEVPNAIVAPVPTSAMVMLR